MPIYEYACTACGERTEAKQSFDDPPLEDCARCGGGLRKLYSPVGIVFKGSGFYATDSRKTSSAKSETKPSTDKTSGDKAEKGSPGAAKSESSGSKDSSSTPTSSGSKKAAS